MTTLKTLLLMLAMSVPVTSTYAADKPSEPTTPDPVAIAIRLLDHMDAGEFALARAGFTAEMKAALDVDTLEALQAQLSAAGAVQGRDPPEVSARSGMSLVVIHVRRATAEIDVKITVDADGKVAGLHYAPAGPEAAAAPPADASYSESEVSVGTGARALPATLAMPRGDAPAKGFPAIVLVHGSGPQDRNETIGPNRPFLDIARGLAARGIAVLRYEKRTKARPQDVVGTAATIDSETTDDAVTAVRTLASQPKVDPARVFVFGHSQGGMMAPRIAAQAIEADAPVAGLVLFAAPSRRLLDILIEQNQRMAVLDDGTTSDAERAALDTLRAQVSAVRAGGDIPDVGTPMGQPAAYWRSTDGVDPVAEGESVALPMLVLQGARDIQVVDADWQGWKAAFHDNAKVTFKLYPELSHLGIAGTGEGSLADYRTPGHVHTQLIDDVASWIDAH